MSVKTASEERKQLDDIRWRAVLTRDPAANGRFVYAVRTTGIYCRNVCPARRALRKNVLFFDDPCAAESAGFRPCLRCQPADEGLQQSRVKLVENACRAIESASRPLSLAELARIANLSPFHFHRVFKEHTGTTPHRYAMAFRRMGISQSLDRCRSVAEAAAEAGFRSMGQFFGSSTELLGMAPTAFRNGGRGLQIRYGIAGGWLGTVLVAATDRGICDVSLADEGAALVDALRRRFPNAVLEEADARLERLIADVVARVSNPASKVDLPLDIRGTALQQRVWDELLKIPAGKTLTYTKLARRLGVPKSVRAVAGACAANKLAILVPCHRVIRSDGSLAGYRWGLDRKRRLLSLESGETVRSPLENGQRQRSDSSSD